MEHTENSAFTHDIDDVNMSDNEDDGGGNREDEAQEVGNNPAGETIKPKRIIKNPQPKLDASRLMGPRGIIILPNTFKETKFKGKGYEREDLNVLMKKLEHWAHRLFPKLTFDDTIKQIEKLGTKKPVQNLVRRIRLDMYQSDELVEGTENTGTENSTAANEVDVFDEILGTGPYATNSNRLLIGNGDVEHFNDLFPSTPIISSCPASNKKMTLTEEQKERIERNKRLAAERRKAKIHDNKNLKEFVEEGCGNIDKNNSHLPPKGSSQTINSDEIIKTVVEIDSSTTSPNKSSDLVGPSYISKATSSRVGNDDVDIPDNLHKTVLDNESDNNLGEILLNNQQNTADGSGKSCKIFTEDDILSLMDDDV